MSPIVFHRQHQMKQKKDCALSFGNLIQLVCQSSFVWSNQNWRECWLRWMRFPPPTPTTSASRPLGPKQVCKIYFGQDWRKPDRSPSWLFCFVVGVSGLGLHGRGLPCKRSQIKSTYFSLYYNYYVLIYCSLGFRVGLVIGCPVFFNVTLLCFIVFSQILTEYVAFEPKVSAVCLCVCVSVCVCVCNLYSPNGWADFVESFYKQSRRYLPIGKVKMTPYLLFVPFDYLFLSYCILSKKKDGATRKENIMQHAQ